MERNRLFLTVAIVALFGFGSLVILFTNRPGEVEKSDDNGVRAVTYSMSEVEMHGNKESCWAVVNGDVFNLTDWIDRHPGGEKAILSLCGTDATAAFEGQHEGQSQPETALQSFKIGILKK